MGLANMLDNRTILEKADLALADLTTSGGMLQPAQAQKFLRILIKESVLLKQATVVPMRSPKQLIEKIRFSGRILRAGSEAVALSPADRAKPDLGLVELDAQLFKAEVRLNNEVLEDSIERAELRQTIMQLMAEAIARDMDDVIVSGDKASVDPFYAKLDGVLKQASPHIVDAGGASTNKTLFRDLLKSMPPEFRRNKKELRFYTSVDSEVDYRDSLAERATVVGNQFLQQDAPVMYGGVPLMSVPMFPENLGTLANSTCILLTDPKNIQIGIWRNIRVETFKDVPGGVLIIVATLRFDVKFAEPLATSKAINVAVAGS